MSVLITGGAGYIGSHMAWELSDQGEDIIVADDLSTGFRGAVPGRAKLAVGDVGDRRFIRDLVMENEVEAIMHFAGSIIVPESMENPLKYYENNTVKSRELIAAAIECRIDKFIFSSSAAVYGAPVSADPIREDAVLDPVSPYGSSKLMTEIMLRDAARAHDLRYVMLRYFNVAGADPKGRTGQSTAKATHLIKVACETALGKRDGLTIFGDDYDTPDGTCVRDYIHVTDLVLAHYAALNYLRQGGAGFTANCGYGHGHSVRDVVDSVRRVSGVDFDTGLGPRRPGDPPVLVADPNRLLDRVGWEPRYDDLDLIIRTALDWERSLAERRIR